MTGADVVACARTQIGVPWVHQGRMWGAALDCAGLVICVARELGIVPAAFDVTGYTRTPDGTMLDRLGEHLTPTHCLEVGSVLCVATERDPQHLGIVADYLHGGFSLIHATNAGSRRVVESRIMFVRNFKRRGVYRFPGVA